MFDGFVMESNELTFSHFHGLEKDWILEGQHSKKGTDIGMIIFLDSKRTDKEVFEAFSGGEDEDYAFNKTVIPVDMARIDKENLVSRSQAKRLLIRIENFKYVLFDFKSVDTIGQAFADEIFRVYRRRHPDITIQYSDANEDVRRMIKRAEAGS